MKNPEDLIREIIEGYNMQPHPEGGWYVETYRHPEKHIFPGFDGPRNLSTSILFLLPEGKKSALHRIKSDEIWYHHAGGTLYILTLDHEGKEQINALGPQVKNGESLQYVVRAGTWFGAEPAQGAGYCLVGCQVSPGFDFKDFELL